MSEEEIKKAIQQELDYYKRQIKELSAQTVKQDASLSTAKHKLRQKELGFALLSKLQALTTFDLSPEDLVLNILKEINSGLKMDGAIMVSKTKGENTFKRVHALGKSNINALPESLEIEVPDHHWDKGYLLINSETKKDNFLDDLSKSLQLPFFICLPWMANNQLNFLICGRFKEAGPFSPKLDHGDVETLQSILSFMSARLEMRAMKNLAIKQERIQADLKIKAEKEQAKSLENALRAEAAELQLKAAEAQARALDAEERRKREELERARSMQLSMLPNNIPEFDGFEVAATMVTATEVGGDYYDFLIESPSTFSLVVGDASGHGISAGLMMSMTKVALHSCPETSPSKILSWMNALFKKTNPINMNMALNVARIENNTVTFASAAIPPVFHYSSKNNEVKEIMISGLPLGAIDGAKYDEHNLNLEKEDSLLILSDGLPESLDDKEDQIGYDRIAEIFKENAKLPVEEQISRLITLGNLWRKENDLEDDITLLLLRKS